MPTLRRFLALFVILALLAISPPARADGLWDMTVKAQAYEKSGQIDQAIPLWEQMAPRYAENGNPTNAAIFYGKLGKAYDQRNLYDKAVAAYEQEAHYWALAGHADWGKEDLLRADQLRTVINLYVQRPAARPNRPLAKYEPPAGALFGAYTEEDPGIGMNFDKAAQRFGKPLGAMLIYWDYDRTYPPDTFVQAARKANAGLQIALQPVHGLDEVQDDAHLHYLARTYKEAGIPIFLRFAGEMNGDWVAWHTAPATYIQKFQLIARVMHAEAPNVALVWSPNELPEGSISDYYPGDEAVDWVGLSMYSDFYGSGLTDHPAEHESPLDKLKFLHTTYADRKPIMISEWGVANREYTTNQELDAWAIAKIRQLYAGLPRAYPGVKAVFYWSVDEKQYTNTYTGTAWSSHRLTEKPAVLQAFAGAVADPYYLSRPDGSSAPYRYDPLVGHLQAAPEVLSADVKLYDPIVSKVEWLLNGQVIGTAENAPYTLHYDFRAYDTQTVQLTLRAYNASGALDAEKTQPLRVGFTDLAEHWAGNAVRTLAARGVVSGDADGRFLPDAFVQREAFYAMLARSLNLPAGQGPSPFTDLPVERWSFPYAKALLDAGILVISDYPGAALHPGDAITHQEMAALAARAAHLAPAGTASFPDAGEILPQWQALAAAAQAAHLVRTDASGRLGANTSGTRGEAADLIAHLLTPDPASAHQILLQLGNPQAWANGNAVTLEVAPQLVNNRTMVPLRFLSENMGLKVEWDGVAHQITLTGQGRKILLWVANPQAQVDGKSQMLDAPPTPVNGHTLVPLRFITENLGVKMKYDAIDHTILLETAGGQP